MGFLEFPLYSVFGLKVYYSPLQNPNNGGKKGPRLRLGRENFGGGE